MAFPMLPAATGFGFASLTNAFASFFNSGRQREVQIELHQDSQRFQAERDRRAEEFALAKAKLDYTIQFGRDEQSREFQAEQGALTREHQSREAAIQRFFQERENQLNRESQRELTELVQNREDLRQKDRQQHDRVMQADRQRHELEVQQKSQAFALYQMYLQMREQRQSKEYDRVMARHPLHLTPTTILEWYEAYQQGDRPLPPLVIISPPTLAFDRYNPNNTNPYLGEMSKSLEEEVRVFFETYGKSARHPVRYISRLWDTKMMAADTAASHLHALFKTIPTVVLELEAEEALFNFRFFSWDMGDEHYQSRTILSQFSLKQLVFDIQKDLARHWATEKPLLEAAGLNVAALIAVENSAEAIDEHNLKMLQTEMQLRKAKSDRSLPYLVSIKGVERLKQYLRCLTCLVAGLAIDDYHLSRYGTTPQLPSLMGSFLTDLPELEAHSLLDHLVQHYQDLTAELIKAGSWRMPEVAIEMAEQLSQLPLAHRQAKALIDLSISCWLSQRQIDPGNNALEAMAAALSIADRDYVETLNAARKNLGKTQQLDIAVSCYFRGMRRLETREHGAARADFDQVISLNPHADAYFQRALACMGLEEYQSAVNDLDQVVMLQPNRAEAYEYRGDVYRQLGNYETALANYNQAQSLGSQTAKTKRDDLQRWWQDSQRQQKAQDYFNGGVYHFEKGNYEQALADFEQAHQHGHREARQKAQEVKAEQERRKNLIYKLPNGGGDLEFVWVPAGVLKMEGGHEVTLKEFRISKYPITQRQYFAIMKTNPSHFTADLVQSEEKKPIDSGNKIDRPVESGKISKFARPVEQVTWDQAGEFCTKLSGQDYMGKQKVSLPSETQWEWAARGATLSKGYTYAGSNTVQEVAWYDQNSKSKTHPVGQLKGNELEIHDMSGNVWEWCMDNWTDSPNVLPRGGTPYKGGDSSGHAVRGGSWDINSSDCRCARRVRFDDRINIQGFRVVLLDLSGVSGVSL